jgi:nucleotide-binding universal stress UspA family protein
MKNILLPTDFSKASINAIDYAVQLYMNEECTFYIINTYEPVALFAATTYGNSLSLDADLGELFKTKSEEHVIQTIDAVAAKYPDTKHIFKGISAFNILILEIEQLVKDYHIDIIVMGTNGASGLKEVFIGSQTMHVIKSTTVPVIGVPAAYSFKQPKDVLFTTDYKTDIHQKGLPLLDELCRKYISRIIFLNAYQGVNFTEKQVKNKEDLSTYFKQDAPLAQTTQGMDVLEAIEDFQSRHGIDLLVLIHNKHNFFENLLFKPVVQKVVYGSDIPFMILPDPN